MRKILSLLVLSSLILCGCSSGESEDINPNSENELNIYGWSPTISTSDTEVFEEWASNELGFPVNVTMPAQENNYYLSASMSAGNNFDLIIIDQYEYYSLIEQGALVDITDSLNVYNLPTYFSNLYVDESIYAFPIYNPGYMLPYVRMDWLQEFGMGIPTTIEEWNTYFEMCKKEKDAYGIAVTEVYDFAPFLGYFGIAPGVYQTEEGTYYAQFLTEDIIPFLEWLNYLYLNEYLEPNYAINVYTTINELIMTGEVGCVVQNSNYSSSFPEEIESVENENNTYVYNPNTLLAIPANAHNPDMALAFMELWYSESGKMVVEHGYEGYTYNYSGEKIVYTEEGTIFNERYDPMHPVTFDEDVNANVTSNPSYIVSYSIKPIVQEYYMYAIEGEMTPEDAVKSVQEEINLIEGIEFDFEV